MSMPSKRPLRPMIAAGLLLAPCAFAAASAAESSGLEEIVVTASKREERLIEVPISITAIDREAMDTLGVRDIDDITRLTPGLANIPTATYGGSTIAIRGIYSNTGASTTGIYIDDTPVQTRNYLGVVNNSYPLVFDLERVEVLRGPQGTLFGAGSEGGTVRFITPTPSLVATRVYERSEIAFTDGGRPGGELGVALETPIAPDLAAVRASAWGRHVGGYIDRVAHDSGGTQATRTNGSDDAAARVTVRIAPDPALTITPSLYFQQTHRHDLDLYWPQAGLYRSWYGIGQPEQDRFVLPALTIEYASAAVNIKSITSYFDRHDDRVEDYAPLSIGALTGGAASFVPGVNFRERSDTVTRQRNLAEELRLSSPHPEASISWLAGLFFYQGKQDYEQNEVDNIGDLLAVLFPGYTTLTFYGQDQLPGHVSFLQTLTFKTWQRALFGEVSWRATERLKLTAGLRVEHSSFDYRDYQNGPFVGPVALYNSGGQKEDPVTPRVNVSWNLGQGQLYATAAKGYRAGGVNEPVPVTCAADLAALGLTAVPATYKSDTVWSYELGLKRQFLQRRLDVNASVYWVDWSGIQSNIPLLNCGFGYNTNLGHAVSKGFDLQVQARPLPDLLLNASVGYDRAAYSRNSMGEVPSGTAAPVVLARSGDGIGIPDWQAALSAEYGWSLGSALRAYVLGDYRYTGTYQRTGSQGVVGYNPYTYHGAAVQLSGLRAGLRRSGWDVSVYASNLFNTRSFLYFYQAPASGPDGARAETPRPRTVGLTASYRY